MKERENTEIATMTPEKYTLNKSEEKRNQKKKKKKNKTKS